MRARRPKRGSSYFVSLGEEEWEEVLEERNLNGSLDESYETTPNDVIVKRSRSRRHEELSIVVPGEDGGATNFESKL